LASDHGWCPIKPQTFESLLVGGVHVIGDACIADPMPKSASAAGAQARQCAFAIAASLEGREAAAPNFDSVCYSLLEAGSALSIHGRFRLAEGLIQQIQGTEDSQPVTAAQEARNADDWYRRILQDSFGATVAGS
jgi:sulfide dehydrogenase [flavocytochrome c] flavoprotein subunit